MPSFSLLILAVCCCNVSKRHFFVASNILSRRPSKTSQDAQTSPSEFPVCGETFCPPEVISGNFPPCWPWRHRANAGQLNVSLELGPRWKPWSCPSVPDQGCVSWLWTLLSLSAILPQGTGAEVWRQYWSNCLEMDYGGTAGGLHLWSLNFLCFQKFEIWNLLFFSVKFVWIYLFICQFDEQWSVKFSLKRSDNLFHFLETRENNRNK